MFRNTNIGILVRKVVRFYAFNWRSLDYFCFFKLILVNASFVVRHHYLMSGHIS